MADSRLTRRGVKSGEDAENAYDRKRQHQAKLMETVRVGADEWERFVFDRSKLLAQDTFASTPLEGEPLRRETRKPNEAAVGSVRFV